MDESTMTRTELRQVISINSLGSADYMRAKQELDGRLARRALWIAGISAVASAIAMIVAFR